ncbi:hypothetical protein MIMGU_mgv1a016050mg [Erythranthe guttata]|uniref:Uncharacterized protein n=1 Tax=Erythranthe guttata TaxID=4155 RepID=A0A022QEE7_ERYGU|nr:hypothetical protein MIMGU_mgv1a016050mg [Erythranthe guttata]
MHKFSYLFCLFEFGFFAYGFQRLSRGAGDSLLFSCNFLFFVFTQSNFITFFIRNHCFLCFLFLRVFYVQLQVSPFLVFRLRFAVALSVRIQVCRLFKNYIDVFQGSLLLIADFIRPSEFSAGVEFVHICRRCHSDE